MRTLTKKPSIPKKTRTLPDVCPDTTRARKWLLPEDSPSDFCERGALPEDFGDIEIIIL